MTSQVVKTMYKEDPKGKALVPEEQRVKIHQTSKTIKVSVDGKEFLIPDPKYVTFLEEKINRLDDDLKNTTQAVKILRNKIAELEHKASLTAQGGRWVE